ncbi:general stress protein [Paenibacillus mendelii]|uniref:General stress protein n=1 Tax=Paenibacillus mendelii TaxID=206163 RepID=A0ABV6JM74_9BACL|nr:general stress protein [Paenibacillus mendelii]MCQ6558836.1 general stress protein [Paenibacillus mendelii]
MKTNITTATHVHTVNTAAEAREQVERHVSQGYTRDQLFVLAHDKDRSERLTEQTATEQIGLEEEGLGTAVANIFRSRGDKLRAKMRSVGIGADEAERLEQMLDQDKIIVIAWSGKSYESDDDYDPYINYYPPFLV